MMTEQAKPSPPKFVDRPGKSRFKDISLQWPIEYDGKVYETIRISRPSMGQWRAYWKDVEDGKEASMPCFEIPKEVIDSLDPDDDEVVIQAVNDFFPKRSAKEKTQSLD